MSACKSASIMMCLSGSPGRPLVRSVCMVFDKYLRQSEARTRFSRVM